ncbi:hypothetical protein LWC35_22590, partial [Pseudonocardia kujensis]|nr:hypothetical protein [Pseudonocardia kujensis]
AGVPGVGGAAGATAVRAATAATAGAAHEDAVRWLATALTHLDPAGPVPGRGEVLCALGEAALAAGDPGRSRAVYLEAAADARRHDRPDLLATAALGATGGTTGFEIDLRDPGRCALLEEALAAVPPGEPALRAALAARLSVALAFTGDEPRRLALADEAVAGARRLGDPRVLAAALAARCDATAGPAHVAERRAAADEIVACARRIPDRARELLGRRLRTVALAEAGRWADVDVEIAAYAHVAQPLRQAGLSWCVPLWRGARALAAGDEEAWRRHDAELAGLVTRSRSGNAEILLLTQRFVAAVLGGRPEDADLEGFLRLAPALGPSVYATHALLRALAGEPGAADLLDRWLDGRAAGPHDSEWLPEAVQVAQAALLLGDRTAAARTYALLLPHAGLFAVEGMVAGTWGSVDAFLGRLAALRGDSAAARRHLVAAVEADARAGAALERRTRAWAAELDGVGEPAGRTEPDQPAGESGAVGTAGPSAGPTAGPAEFRREGELWALSYAGRTVRLRNSKGLRDLAVLLARPGREVAVHELAGVPAPDGSGLVLADRTAVAAYRTRLRDLDEEVEDAAATHDPERSARATAERDALIAELAAVTGLGGRPRTAGSDVERRRKAVGNRVRAAVDRVAAVHPELGRHLRASVHTGTFCRYDPEHAVTWRL